MAKTKKSTSTKKSSAKKDPKVTVDRRAASDRRQGDRRKEQVEVEVERRAAPRRKVARRRQIDPTTCERDYTDREIEFMDAMDEYKRASGRMFPTCSEILEVVEKLGYARLTPEEQAAREAKAAETATEELVGVTESDDESL